MKDVRGAVFNLLWAQKVGHMFVMVAPRAPGLALPARVLAQTGATPVVLRLESDEQSDNQGFTIDEGGFTALMSFDLAPFTVVVPWSAIVAIEVPGVLTMGFNTTWAPEPPKPGLRLVKP